jgi:putative Mg2+ transporter-C (MgtC) family protein
MLETVLEELHLLWPDGEQLVRVAVRLTVAALLGAIIGFDRERMGKPAGLRTHMLVALGSALFVLAPMNEGMPIADLSRIIQGVAAGIGFLGAGAILKLSDERHILGLTTAASIWMTAAIGITAGLGQAGLAVLATLVTWVILAALSAVERKMGGSEESANEP